MANVPEDVPIESKMVTRAIQSAQGQVEQQNFEIRKNVLKYDEVLNRQREVIYGERHRVLEGEDLRAQIDYFMDDTVDAYIKAATAEGFAEEWDLEQLWGALGQLYPIAVRLEDLEEESGDRAGLTADLIAETVREDIHNQYHHREEQLGSEIMRELERRVVLSVLDRRWREHLYEMDYLQEGIGLRAVAQRDPLVEYQREGYDMFVAMMEGIKEESVGYLFNLEVQVEHQVEEVPVDLAAVGDEPVPPGAASVPGGVRPEIRAQGLATPKRPERLHLSAPSVDGAGAMVERDVDNAAEVPAQAQGEGEPAGQTTRAQRRKASKGRRRKR
jgi:preprotein translocase subunit SecA